MAETTKRQSEDNIDRVSQSAHKAIDRAASVASDYAGRMSAKGEELMSMHEDWLDTAREYVREKPLQALGIALAAGYLLHVITRRR
ncbi:MAG: YqjD family protein [Burkholderiales bacterium]